MLSSRSHPPWSRSSSPSQVSACSYLQCFLYKPPQMSHFPETPRSSESPTSFVVPMIGPRLQDPGNMCLVAGSQAKKVRRRYLKAQLLRCSQNFPCVRHTTLDKRLEVVWAFPCLPPSWALGLFGIWARSSLIHLPKTGCVRQSVGDPPPPREPRHPRAALPPPS